MAYSATDWVDGVTPVNAANMDKIEAGLVAAEEKALRGVVNGYASLDASGQVPSAQLPSPSIAYYRAEATSDLTLTTSAALVPGTGLTFAFAGTWLVLAVYDFFVTAAGVGICIGSLAGSATILGSASSALMAGEAIRGTVAQTWVVTGGAGATVGLNANKTSAGGAASAVGTHTVIRAIRLG